MKKSKTATTGCNQVSAKHRTRRSPYAIPYERPNLMGENGGSESPMDLPEAKYGKLSSVN